VGKRRNTILEEKRKLNMFYVSKPLFLAQKRAIYTEEANLKEKRKQQSNTWIRRILIQFEVSKIYMKFKDRIDEWTLKVKKEFMAKYLVKKYRKYVKNRYGDQTQSRFMNQSIRGPVMTLFSMAQLKEEKAAEGIYRALKEYNSIGLTLKLMSDWYDAD
jgi:hypothetical protein